MMTVRRAGDRRLFLAAPVAFYGLHQRHQALAGEFLAAGWQVDYLEPMIGGGFSCTVTERQPGLRIITVRVPFRAAQWPAWQTIATRLLAHQLRAGGLGSTRDQFLWLADPALEGLCRWRWRGIAYDRCDRHGWFPGQRALAWRCYERRLAARADLLTASHPLLQTELAAAGGRPVHLLPNAAPRDWFRDTPAPCLAGSLRVISAGAHFEWTDFSWLEAFVGLPGVELHLAGPGRGEAFHRLTRRPGVVAHGGLSHDRLRALLDEMQVGLVPFLDTPLTAGVDPIKVYEYAARGLAVWAPPTAGLREHPFVGLALTRAEVSSACRNRLAEALSEAPPLRRDGQADGMNRPQENLPTGLRRHGSESTPAPLGRNVRRGHVDLRVGTGSFSTRVKPVAEAEAADGCGADISEGAPTPLAPLSFPGEQVPTWRDRFRLVESWLAPWFPVPPREGGGTPRQATLTVSAPGISNSPEGPPGDPPMKPSSDRATVETFHPVEGVSTPGVSTPGVSESRDCPPSGPGPRLPTTHPASATARRPAGGAP